MLTVIPVCHKDHAAACRLAAWIIELGGASKHQCLAVLARDLNPGPLTDMLRAAFRSVAVMPLQDREPPPNPNPEGLPHAAGANLMFRRAAKEVLAQGRTLMSRRLTVASKSQESRARLAVIGYNLQHPQTPKPIPAPERLAEPEPFLWLEPDAVPLHPDWLDVLEASYKALPRGKRFMGALVNKPPVAPFMSGVAVYPWDAANISSLVTCEHAAFDVNSAKEVLPQMAETKLIQHEWGASEEWPDLSRLRAGAVIYHQCKTGSLIQLLKDPHKESLAKLEISLGIEQPACDPRSELPPYSPEELQKSGDAWRANADYEIRRQTVEAAKEVYTEPMQMPNTDFAMRLGGTHPPFDEAAKGIVQRAAAHLRMIHDAGEAERKAVLAALKQQGLVSASNGKRARRKPIKRK